MLVSLHVRNLALIEETEVFFQPGLNILTGETGAGKSVILGSVALALGAKADRDMIRTGAEYALIELTFEGSEEVSMNSEDVESTKIWARGYIVREACKTPSNFRSEETLDAFLKKNGIIGIEGIDTRSLTRTLRESGVMNGAITTEFDPDAEPEKKAALLPEIAAYAVIDAVKTVTCREAVTYEPTAAGAWGDTPLHVALLDLGCIYPV